jgi:hypothetical protein
MASFEGRFQYSVPAGLSADGFTTSIYANFTWSIANRTDFPRELCPDSWKWFPDRDTAKLPMEVYYIPRGSWLSARLAQLCGGQDQFTSLLSKREEIPGQKEFHLDIDVISVPEKSGVGRLTLKFNREMMRLGGRCVRGKDREIAGDFQAILCAAPLSVAYCHLDLDGESIGWNDKQYFGAGVRPSRFAKIREEEEKYEKLKSLNIQLERGNDSVANDPALLSRIGKYLKVETADCAFIEGNLQYLRSAVIGEAQYWIWDYRESDGKHCYVTLRLHRQRSVLGFVEANELSPEQYIYADHHNYFADDKG